MLAVFFTQACALVDIDLMNGLRGPFWWVLSKGAAYGLAVALSVMATRNRKRFLAKAALAAALVLVFVLGRIDSGFAQRIALSGPARQDIQWRVAMDGTVSLVALVLGYALLFRSMISQGIKHVRTRAELALAEQVQQVLAPPPPPGAPVTRPRAAPRPAVRWVEIFSMQWMTPPGCRSM